MDLGKESSDDEVLSKPALEYYRKHSLNPDLGKYFTGTSTSVISEFTPRERRLEPPLNEVEIIIDVETEAQEMDNKGSQTDLEESISNKNLSPTSSVASIKKLEWDNGADIGYDNCRKTFLTQKSSSLPILSNADTNRKVELLQKAQSKHINKVWSAGNVEHLKLVPNLSSSSSSSSPEESPKDSPKLYNLESSSTSYALMDNKSSTTSSSGALPEKASKCTLSSQSSKIMETESSTRTSSKKSARSHESTSSSQDKHIDEKHKKFSETLKFLKQKIGYPDAESTPKLPETTSLAVSDEKYSETPLQKKPDKPPRKNVNVEFLKRKESKSYENLPITTKSDDKVLCLKNSKKSVKLCPTKPSCIECIDNKIPEKKAVLNKVSQTSFGVKKSTQSVQTEEADDKLIHFIECPDNSRENQKIIYWEHADLDNNGLSKSSNTQTDSDLISNCESFVYLLGKPPLEYPAQSSSDKEDKTITFQKIQKDKQITSTSASSFQQRRNSTSDTESILTDSRLSDILSKNLSKDINVDIEKSIDILRKLLKSKRYDQGTKNRYIRKIVKKLLDSKYTHESSASSELFQPRRCEGMAPPVNIGGGDQPKATNLQANLPWYPAQREIKHRSPVKRHKILDNKITHSEILPGTSKYDKMLSKTSKDDNVIKPVILKNPRSYNPNKNFTLTNNELLITHNYSSSSPTYKNETSPPTDSPLLQSSPKDLDTSPRNTESHSTTNILTENRNENWKEEKTQSEKLLEGVRKFTGHGDQLVNFAKSERQHQISWINNEIEHLVMLKEMLEKKKRPKLDSKKKASLMEVLQKVHVEDICGKEMELQESASDQSVKLRKKGKRDEPSTEVDRKSQRMEKEIELSEKDKTKIRKAKDESPESSPSEDDRLAKTKRKEKEDKSIEKDQVKRRKDKEVSPEPSPSESDRSQKSKRSGTEGELLEKDKDKKRKDKDVSPESSPSESDRTKTKRKEKEDKLPEKAKDKKRKDKDVSPESSPSESDRLSKTKQKEKEDKSSVDKKRKTKDVSPESSPSESDAKRKDESPEEAKEKRRRPSFESDRAVGSRSKEKDKDKIRKPKDASPESSPSESDKRDKDAKEKSKKALEKKKADELPYSPEISPSEDEERGSRKKKSQTKDKDQADKYSMTRLDDDDSPKESDSEESSSTDSENTGITCVCCKKKAIPSSKWFNLYQKLNERPPQLCSPCYKVGQGNTYQKPYSQGNHNCVCYSMVNSGTLNEIRQTVGEMQRMQAFEEFAEICSTAKKPKHRRCKHCKCKVNPKYKNGIAYQLTLEDTHVSEMSSPKKKKKKNLNEIKIKIPVTSKKKHKNKENNKRKDRSEKGQNTEDDKEAQADEDDTKSELTLQDYLAQNMPGFVSAADSRRKTVLDAVNQRAADKDDRKLKFLDSDSNKESSSKKKAGFSLFSEKEMKSMTRKNYKQLAEVKKMKRDEKELRLRQSNRLITNLFSKRLQKNVLEGKRSLPLDAKVVNY